MKRRIAALTLLVSMPLATAVRSTAEPADRARSHDFDFLFGTWSTHITFLPQAGSSRWVTLDGTVVTEPVWNGRANLEEIEATGPARRFEGMTLRLYDPRNEQWNLY
ncbi:MAG: hypothetical protein JO263_01215 [Candidatus Eremiobacteraeota bacterium]|nr:hypothetical protein [Candidatus Eremiobacteraeota bacterium]